MEDVNRVFVLMSLLRLAQHAFDRPKRPRP
jgi:hypothetical protein